MKQTTETRNARRSRLDRWRAARPTWTDFETDSMYDDSPLPPVCVSGERVYRPIPSASAVAMAARHMAFMARQRPRRAC